MSDNGEFWKWYHKHEAHFQNYSIQEICVLAKACGFNTENICRNVDAWLSQSRNKLRLWESPFHKKWVRVWLIQTGYDGD